MMQKKTLKHVCFDENTTTVGRSAYNAEESKSSWLSPEDAKRNTLELLKGIAVIRHRHALPNQSPMSYSNNLLKVYTCCVEGKYPNESTFQCFALWNKLRPHRRGLERSGILASFIRSRRSQTISLFITLQSRLHLLSTEDKATLLQQAYARVVQPERTFARLLAIADASSASDLYAAESALLGPSNTGEKVSQSLPSVSTRKPQQPSPIIPFGKAQVPRTLLPVKKGRILHDFYRGYWKTHPKGRRHDVIMLTESSTLSALRSHKIH